MFILNLKRLVVFEILHLRLGCWRENALRFSSYSVHLNAGILVTCFHSFLTNLYNFQAKNQCLIFRKNKKPPSWSRLFACQRWWIDFPWLHQDAGFRASPQPATKSTLLIEITRVHFTQTGSAPLFWDTLFLTDIMRHLHIQSWMEPSGDFCEWGRYVANVFDCMSMTLVETVCPVVSVWRWWLLVMYHGVWRYEVPRGGGWRPTVPHM